MQRATPGTESRRGLTVQSASVRNSMGESLSETRPILSKSMVEDVSGDILGDFTPTGSTPANSASRSANICRAPKMAVPSLNTDVLSDTPEMHSNRDGTTSHHFLMV